MSEANVYRVRECRLTLSQTAWSFAEVNKMAIARHWSAQTKDNPSFFNGRVLMLESYDLAGDLLGARFFETDFANFLYWNEHRSADEGVADGFGSALIRARGGEVLLARQKAGNVNAGLVYMPGGFIDPRDVTAVGMIDIDASVARELEEETGLSFNDFSRRPGYLITNLGSQVSIAIELISELEAHDLRAVLMENLSLQADPELEDFVIYDSAPAVDDTDVVPFSQHALAAVFA